MISADPTHPYFLTFCYVCSEEAKTNGEHIRNYGAIVCFSCRAFWRRTHQKDKKPNYVCKKAGGCVLTVENRRSCQKCRFDRCDAAGMLADAVLTEEQKEVRFQKFIQRKKNKLLVKTEPEDPDDERPKQRRRSRKRKLEVKSEVTSPADSPQHLRRSSFDEINSQSFQHHFHQSMAGKEELISVRFE